jgi:hypothetical protein
LRLKTVQGRRILKVLHDRRQRGVAVERNLSREELEDDDPHRVEIASLVHALAAHLLGAHVLRGADERSRGGHMALGVNVFGDAEVHQADDAPGVAHDVRSLQVAMDNAFIVDRFEPIRDLDRNGQGLAQGKRALRSQNLAQVHALDELHGDEIEALVGSVLVDAAYVLVCHPTRQLDLGSEALSHLRRARHVGAQHLHRYHVVEDTVLCLVDHAHSAATQRREHLVALRQQ